MTPDPIGSIDGEANVYMYARNNPVKLFDSFGLFCQTLGCFPVDANLDVNDSEKDLTDWKLSGANDILLPSINGFSYSAITCRYKKMVEITMEFVLTTTYECLRMCISCSDVDYDTFLTDKTTKSEFSYSKEKKKSKDIGIGPSYYPPGFPQPNEYNILYDLFNLSPAEKKICPKNPF